MFKRIAISALFNGDSAPMLFANVPGPDLKGAQGMNRQACIITRAQRASRKNR
jgi:hypothetical protein